MKKVIYDFGANNGDNIPYYLMKSDLVVAVEANPILCNHINSRYSDAIRAGSLVVENCVLDTRESATAVPFYIHKTRHFLSQFPRPASSVREQFNKVLLPSRNVVQLIKRYGAPYYVKIDLEHFDNIILRALFLHNIFPPYLSAESHSIDVFCTLVALGKYQAFKLVDGATVSTKYKDHAVETDTGISTHSFSPHAAGPFGNDIQGDWMTKDNFARLLLLAGLGWRDIHVSKDDTPNPAYAPSPQYHIRVQVDY